MSTERKSLLIYAGKPGVKQEDRSRQRADSYIYCGWCTGYILQQFRLPCLRCTRVNYCREECREQDQVGHQTECGKGLYWCGDGCTLEYSPDHTSACGGRGILSEAERLAHYPTQAAYEKRWNAIHISAFVTRR